MTTLVDRLRHVTGAKGEFEVDVRSTYFQLRMAAGLIGALLPFVLVGWGLLHDVPWNRMSSLSSFYWLSLTPPIDSNALLRNWFVGSLIAVGCCLIVYQGYGRLEDWLLNFAGLAAIIMGLDPMPWPGRHTDPLNVHYLSALTFFLLIGATIWFCARDTLAQVHDPRVRRRWDRLYRILAVAMIAAPLAAFLLARKDQRTIWVEALGVWVFSSFWFSKTYELSRVSEIEPAAGPAPTVRRIAGRLMVLRPGAAQG
ncbi:MAG: hypothetical protein WBW93_20805 [Steroidobacteraceae bacterium]